MAKSEKADFSLTIGLNLDDLFRGMDEANATISQAISRINSENKQVKLKADISELKAGDDELKKQAIEMQSLTRQIELQTAKLRLLGQARDSAYKRTGDNSSLSRAADTRYLQQEKYVAQLNADLKKMQTASAAATVASTGLFSKISTGASAAKKGVSEVTGAYGMLSTKMAGLMAVGMTGAGLFNITQGAMDAGENLYKLSTRLHLTTSEAGQLNKLFSISGTNIQAVIPFFSQLDKSVLDSSKGLNSTTMALMKFGVNLKDSSGNLLPINEQLDQLAQGYHKAAEAGKEEEFQAQVLGRRGAELIPLLEDYNDNMQIASSIKATGLLDPKEAHELSLEWRKMKAEAGQLQLAFGSALMPIAKELMPEVTDVMIKCIDYIKDNKDDIKESIETAGTALKDVLSILKDIASIMPDATAATKLGEIKGKDNGLDRVKYTAKNGGLLAKIPGIGVSLAEAFDTNDVNEKYYQSLQQQKQAHEEAAKAKKENADAIDDLIKKSEALTQADKTESESEGVVTDKDNDAVKAANANAQAQYKAAQAMEWRASVAGQLSEKIYSLTHNDIENAQHSMWVEVEKAQANGVPQDLIDQFVNAQSARIAEDKFRNVTAPMAEAFKTDLQNQLDQVDLQAKSYIRAGATQEEADAWAEHRKSKINADWDREVASQIDSIWKSSFQNRLDEIDREKEAWKQKGLDEVKATEWAEEKKRETYEETAQSMFSSQLKYYRAWMKGGQEGIMRQMRREMHIPANAMTSPEEIANFQNAMKYAKSNLIPIVPNDQLVAARQAAMGGGNNIEVLRGAMNSATSGLTSSLTGALQPLVTAINNGAGKMFEVHAQPTSYSPNVTINTNLSDTVMTNDIVDLIADRTATKVNSALQPMKDNYYDNKYGV